MKVSQENCMKLILNKFPDFLPLWNAYKAEEDEYFKTSLWGEMSEFSHYIWTLLGAKTLDPARVKEIFCYMEELLVNGDDDVQNAICTCFLENILNVTPEQVDPKQFVSHLGPESRKYCLAWDAFTGVKTEGLDKLDVH
jgi:hypothetical protein